MSMIPPPRRPQFSLLNLVLMTTIVALAFGLFSSARRNARLDARNQQLAAENKKFRSELGIFEVEDPAKVHVIRVPTKDDEPHKFRVYLPPGRRYVQCYKTNGIPERGVPSRVNAEPIEPGHYLFTVSITREVDAKTGEPRRGAKVELKREQTEDVNSTSTYFIFVGEQATDWIINKQTGHMAYSWSEPGRQLELLDPAEPFVLYRARAHGVQIDATDTDGKPTSWHGVPIKGDTDGFMVWIELEPLEGSPQASAE